LWNGRSWRGFHSSPSGVPLESPSIHKSREDAAYQGGQIWNRYTWIPERRVRVEIERLTPEDGERLRSIRLSALRDAPDAFGSTFEETASRPAESWRTQIAELATFVVTIGGEDVALARGTHYEGKPGAAILLSMWVAPGQRGKGVGEALVDAVADWARSMGFTRLLLDVADENGPAIALYARMGFEPTGETSALPFPREHILEHERALEL
jgi:GNAT superfamily N-acetyltransferase